MNKGPRFGRDVKEKILNAGLRIWEKDASKLTVTNVARSLGMTHGNVFYHFPAGLKDAIAEYAIAQKNTRVIVQLIVTGHPLVEKLAPSERANYLKSI